MRRDIIAIAGVELELFEAGDGPPILFLHGAGGFAPEHPYVAPLSARHRLIAPSHPGFGNSSLPDWIDAVDDIAYIHLELLERLGVDQRRRDRLLDRRLDRRGTRDQSAASGAHVWCWSARSA